MSKIKKMTGASKNVANEEAGKISWERCKKPCFRFGVKIYSVFKYMCVATTIIVASCFVTGCNQGEDYIVAENSDNEYLSLPPNFDVSNLADEHLKTLQLAFDRMSIFSTDGIFRTNITSGSQINISENLFVFLNEAIDNSNNRAKEIKPLIPRLKNGGNESPSSNDCVAYAVHKVLSFYKSTISVNSVISYMRNTYGNNGIPSGSFYNAVQHYLEGNTVTITANYNIPSGTMVIVAFNGHAVNLLSCSNGMFLYSDSSGSTSGGVESVSKITHAFKATGKK
jgi:hypothetical protein